jgi:membrane fusion protein (multidrug efflux system)
VSQRLEAQLGVRVAGKVEVRAGIEPGDRVVTAGQSRLLARDALPVRIIELTSGEAPSQPVRAQPAGSPASGMSGSPVAPTAPAEAASVTRPAA